MYIQIITCFKNYYTWRYIVKCLYLFVGYEIVEIGAGAYAFMSLLNHSCAPNVVRHCHGNTIVLRAIRPIEDGQQLYDNYG